MKFKDLKFEPHPIGKEYGIYARTFFNNRFGASVIKSKYSHGGSEGLYELAVLAGSSLEKSSITYNTDITDDVLGHLTETDVSYYLTKIEALMNSNEE